ncbi:neurotrypsin-like [Lytechinus pictus]|uniref:neurotrypsin-like n=1 Tax=Lytechinus pictus TaxID=7653 RepID=UPI0030B9DE5D
MPWLGFEPTSLTLEDESHNHRTTTPPQEIVKGGGNSAESFTVRLVNGSGEFEGRIEVMYDNAFGSVCANDDWDYESAHVICTSLGYSKANVISYDDIFGGQATTVHFKKLGCTGDEKNVSFCPFEIDNGTCRSHGYADASVACKRGSSDTMSVRSRGGALINEGNVYVQYRGNLDSFCGKPSWDYKQVDIICRGLGFKRADIVIRESGVFESTDETTEPIYNETLQVRLSGGSGEHEGLVEVFHARVWGKICANNLWKYESADVVCRHLGYDHAFVIYYDDTFSNDTTLVQFDQVDCAGSETNLASCTSYRYEEGYCKDSAGEGAGVTCVSSETPEVRVRLEGGNGSHHGLVEIFLKDDWRKVCGKGFNFHNGDIVCRSLGYDRAFMIMENGSMVFPTQSGTAIFIDKLHCTGEEHDITECRAYRLKERCDSTYGPAAAFCGPG